MSRVKGSLPKATYLVGVLLLWAVMAVSMHSVYSGDMHFSISAWWTYIADHGYSGVGTIGPGGWADVMPIWYFILFLGVKLGLYPGHMVPCVKALAMVGTIIAVIAVYFIVKSLDRRPGTWRPVIAASLVPFLPAFFLDMLKTNLPDSIYLGLDLMALLAIIKRRPGLAWLLVGVAVGFKPMALYIAPVLFLIYLLQFRSANLIRRIAPLFAVVGLVLTSVPALIAGESLFDATLGIFVARTSTAGSLYWGVWRILFDPAWGGIMPDLGNVPLMGGTIFGASVIVVIFVTLFALIFNARDEASRGQAMLDLLVVSPIVFFMFMPSQHEGYWALASVFAMLVFMVRWSRKSLLLLGILSFDLIEMYMGGRVISPIICEYVLLAVMVYLVVRVFMASRVNDSLQPRALTIRL